MKCSESLVLSITAAAISVAEGMSEDEITLLASAAIQFADTLSTIAAVRDCAKSNSEKEKD